MPPAPDQTNTIENELRIVVDAQIVLAMFLTRRDRPKAASPKRHLLDLLTQPSFRWSWSPDIIDDYERGANAVEADERIIRRAEFDRVGFELLLAALQLEPAVAVSVKTMRDARRRILQAPRAAERDLDDAVYLACAVDGHAQFLVTQDSDLRSLGETYQGVYIVAWNALEVELAKRGLLVMGDRG
ncbi:MAG TPA: PIN domain-containing protein [Pyrinomonadaceae bacterium]|nr:PIN domain-containing protein [Pyrinomonadaceae bacterium]